MPRQFRHGALPDVQKPTSLNRRLIAFAAAGASWGIFPLALGATPDFVVSDIQNVQRWGQVGGTIAFSAAIGACNLGDQDAPWADEPGAYPLFVQNLYRMENNRFEQIGMSWAHHNFICALQTATDVCGVCTGLGGCLPFLPPGCRNTTSASYVGHQPSLGLRTEVNPWLGSAPLPFTGMGQSGDAIFKRMQVAEADISPSAHPGARYFLEVQIVSAGESEDARLNNATFREVVVTGAAGNLNLAPTGAALLGHEALLAWATFDPQVQITDIRVEDDGQFKLGVRVTQLAQDQYRYDYTLHNLNVERAARAFQVFTGSAQITQPYFHDVNYHSGETPDNTNWTFITGDVQVLWETDAFSANPNANALRWGTAYNFSFVADLPPKPGFAAVRLFKPGIPDLLEVSTLVPGTSGVLIGDLNCDGIVTVADIGPFVMALTDPAAYAAAFPSCSPLRGDCTSDGQLTVSDIACFVNLLTGG